MIPALLLATALDLRLDYTRQSLTATYRHYTQYVNGVPVLGGEVIERVDADGSVHEVVRSIGVRASRPLSPGVSPGDLWVESAGAGRAVGAGETPALRPARCVIVRDHPHEPVARYVDEATGEVLREVPLFFHAKGRVFEVNPVAKLNAPQLHDQNNAASAVPEGAYSIVDLLDLPASGPLEGPNVKIIDVQDPHPTRADASQSLMFDRGQPQFEEVNAYYTIDRSQRYLQSLGYTGTRRLVGYSMPVDPHAFGGQDNSVYESSTVPGQGVLFFGDGGTDDVEDPDIVLHEYTHAIQDWIAPGAFFGSSASEARALAEGIADYWGFSQNYVQTVASGRDPYCLGDWDARCDGDDPSEQCSYPPGADCLRRVDGTKTFADFRAIERAGQEHENGAIWSSALREIFEALLRRHPESGRQLSDRIVIESMFGVPSSPTYALLARNMVSAAATLSPADRDAVCVAMAKRGIAVADCNRVPRGELTYFQFSASQLTIADPRAIERVAVHVDGTGTFVLVAPDGTAITLGATSSPATFGIDTLPVDSLDALRGHSAAGTWTLQAQGSATLRSWSLGIQFAGDQPLTARPFSFAPRKHIAAVAHTAGENGTRWITDAHLFNRGDKAAKVTAVYGPDAGGFAAVKLVVAPKQVVALNDIVGSAMQSAGSLGSLEFQGDVADVVITSRTYTQDSRGTFGQFIPGANTAEAIGGATHAAVTHLRNDADFRSNIGFAEVAGESGTVRVLGQDVPVAAFEHRQMPAPGAGDLVADFSVVSGNARILPYGSMVDNKSGDAIYVPARVPPATARTEYAPAISAAGALGTHWSTEVVVTQTFTAHFLGATASGASRRFPNILTELFARDNVLGLLALDLPAGAIATARISTPSDGGSYGQFVPFTSSVHGGDLIQIEVSDDFRTNLGAANTGIAPVVARFTAFDAAGGELGTTERVLQPFELVQFPLTVSAARVRVEGDVLAYASTVDNRSGDAIFVPAQ